jgi:hypothetical protein
VVGEGIGASGVDAHHRDAAVAGVVRDAVGGRTLLGSSVHALIESAKLCGVEPRAYLREATLRAVRNPGTVTAVRDLKSSES